jgi:hypothetical protein
VEQQINELSLVKIPFGANAFEISDIKDTETEALAMQSSVTMFPSVENGRMRFSAAHPS